ncbi:hypothetical protein OH781_13605 [Streptomyces sp. NBC_01550]|uniref:hypothetical protein n=1 Tax=Streptomyces TaxID=1883 RepID=UPI003397FD89|nr:hypothetical protein OG987_14440 [Streptomyces sp. NBC_01620]
MSAPRDAPLRSPPSDKKFGGRPTGSGSRTPDSIGLSAPGGVHDGGPDLVGIGDADEVRAGA